MRHRQAARLGFYTPANPDAALRTKSSRERSRRRKQPADLQVLDPQTPERSSGERRSTSTLSPEDTKQLKQRSDQAPRLRSWMLGPQWTRPDLGRDPSRRSSI